MRFQNVEQARQAQTTFGLPILDVLTISLGHSLSDSNVQQAQEVLDRQDYSEFASRSRASSTLRNASAVIADAFVKCIQYANGFNGYVKQNGDRDTITVHLQWNGIGNSTFHLTQLTANQPIDCKGAEAASDTNKIEIKGARDFLCTKSDPDKSITVVVNTEEHGPIQSPQNGQVDLPGRKEGLQEIQNRLAVLEARSVPPGTIAFFPTQECPSGWGASNELAGRYIVGAPEGSSALGAPVGTPIDVNAQESRPSGKLDVPWRSTDIHVENYGCGAGVSTEHIRTEFNPGVRFCFPQQKSTVGSIQGTNAPYIALRACHKL